MVLVKNCQFFLLFILGIIGSKIFFTKVQNKKTLLQAIELKSTKSRKIENFQKGLVYVFCQKLTVFPCFYIWHYRPAKGLLLQSRTRKVLFQAIKSRSTNSRKMEIFLKALVHGFGQKLAIFPFFYFWQYRPAKCLLRQSRTKKPFCTL